VSVASSAGKGQGPSGFKVSDHLVVTRGGFVHRAEEVESSDIRHKKELQPLADSVMSRRKRTLPQDIHFIGLFIRRTIIKLSSSSGSSEIVGAEIHIYEKEI